MICVKLYFDLLLTVRTNADHCDLTFAKLFKALDIALADLGKLIECSAI